MAGLGTELEVLIHRMGYASRRDRLAFELYCVPDYHSLAELAGNFCLASQECILMAEVVALSTKRGYGFTPKQCCHARLATEGSPELCLDWLVRHEQPASLILTVFK